MRFKAVVFDLDGTLINSLEDLGDSMNAALRANGLPTHPYEDFKLMIGNGVTNLAKRACGSEDIGVYGPVLTAMRENYSRNALNKTYVYPGIHELIEYLSQKAVRLAVLTNKDQDFSVRIIDHYFKSGTFEIVWGAMPGRAIKPDPAALSQLLQGLNVTPQQTIFIGDSGVDMQVACAVGAYAAGASWGLRPKEELLADGADIIIDTPMELLAVVEQA